jgi:hypothetical protein
MAQFGGAGTLLSAAKKYYLSCGAVLTGKGFEAGCGTRGLPAD